jgi:LDH2 family malate/lactate/ureidoglycolate dehydrogenase
MIEAVKSTPRLPGVEEIRIPGELEHALSERRRADGAVPLHPSTLQGFREAAEELGVPLEPVEAA